MPDGGRYLPIPYRPGGAPAVRVLAWPHPLRVERIEAILPAGDTIAGLLDACEFPEWARPHAQVWLADEAMRREPLWIPPQLWRLIRPKAGTVVTVRVVPGKKGSKGFLGILLGIISAAAGFLVPGIGGMLIGLAIKAVGSLLIQPPKTPKAAQGGSGVASSPTYSVSGTRNQAAPYAPVPRLYGRHRFTPPLGALPYTEVVGDDQFLRMIFCLGYGPLLIEDLRIGETPLTSFDDVEYQVRQGFANDTPQTLYTQDVFELPLTIEMTQASGAAIQVSQPDADELSIDITFDRGLVALDQAGGVGAPLTVNFIVEYRVFGSGSGWTDAGAFACVGSTKSLARRGKRWAVPARDQYEVRVTRTTPPPTQAQTHWLEHSIWTSLRTITAEQPIAQTGMALVAVRIRASDQLNGIIDQFNCVATAMLQTLSPSGSAQIDTAQAKFGASSGLFNGVDGWVRYEDHADWAFGSGDFTVDCWFKRSATGLKYLTAQGSSTGSWASSTFGIWINSGNVVLAGIYTGAIKLITGTTVLTDTTSWHHVALVRNGGTLLLFLDGALEGSLDVTGATVADQPYQLAVGGWGEHTSTPWQGWIDEFRISKGIARWTAAFTPPVAEYASDAFTVLLLHMDGVDASTVFVDSSASGKTQAVLPVATRNPAWAYLDALRGTANKRPIADSRIDLPAFAAWAADCDTPAQDGEATFTFDAILDFEGTLFDALRAIAAAGRAGFAMVDGKFSIVQDAPQTVPIQHFTPRNSFGFKGSKPFPDIPHALKVQFVNEDAGWQKDEATVYADGYTAANATKFEGLDTFGITRYPQAWREGRYHQAVAKLRPESYEISTDIEHIVCKRGDLIRVSHDAPLWGGGWARIKSRTLDAASPANVTALVLDEKVTMVEGIGLPDSDHPYRLRVRRADGSSEVHIINTTDGETATLILSAPVPEASAPAVGDLAMFGLYTLESIEAIVLKIEPEADFGARITFADAAPDIHLAYTGPIPEFVSGISQPTPPSARLPALPIIESVLSDEDALLLLGDGSLLTRILVTLSAQSTAAVATAAIETQFRRSDTGEAWQHLALVPGGGGIIEISVMPVDDGAFYDLRLRAVSATDTASDWVGVSNHLVVGKTTPPPDVTNLRREGNWLRWTYDDPPRDLAGFFVRHRPGTSVEWDDALALHGGILGITEISIDTLIGSGTRTIMVKAVDVAGNVSATPATLILEMGDPIVVGVVSTYDFAGGSPAFGIGDIVNGTVVAGELVADGSVLFWSGNDAALFWPASDAALFWSTSAFAEMTYTVTFTPTGGEVGKRLTLVADVSAGIWSFLYRVGGLGSFVPWPGELALEAGGSPQQEYDLRILTGAGSVQGVIRTFVGTVDA